MKTKHMVLSVLGVFVLWLFFWPSEKDHLNTQMAELCKKDGGVKIYEKVKFPADIFDSSGLLKNKPVKEGSDYVRELGPDYKLVSKSETIKNGEPTKNGILLRSHEYIKRLSDGKIMAEVVQYARGGGDRWFAGMPSSDICPDMPINLIESATIKEEN